MLTRYLFYGMIFLLFSSCSKEDRESALFFKVVEYMITKEGATQKIDTITFFTGKDIAWYCESSGELRFNHFPRFPSNDYLHLFVCSNDEFLFPITFYFPGKFSSFSNIPPCLYYDERKRRVYFSLQCDNIDWCEEKLREMEPGWNLFIEQLKKEGRYKK